MRLCDCAIVRPSNTNDTPSHHVSPSAPTLFDRLRNGASTNYNRFAHTYTNTGKHKIVDDPKFGRVAPAIDSLPHHILQHFPVSITTYLWLFVHLHTVELQVYWATESQYLQAVNMGRSGCAAAHRPPHTLWPNAKQPKFAHIICIVELSLNIY